MDNCAPSSPASSTSSCTSAEQPWVGRVGSQQNLSRKRSSTVAELPHTSPSRRKQSRIRRMVITQYLGLLNGEIEDANKLATLDFRDHDGLMFDAARCGATAWTVDQKVAFHAALERLGQSRMDLVAVAAGKSIPEATQYLQLLRQSISRRRDILSQRVKKEDESSDETPETKVTLSARNTAAAEIGPDCEARLEEIADKLEDRELERNELLEREKWGEDWLVNWETSERLEHAVTLRSKPKHNRTGSQRTDGSDESDIVGGDATNDDRNSQSGESNSDLDASTQEVTAPHPELVTAACLLRPGNFIELSTRVFMNPGPPLLDQHWFLHRTATHPTPAMFATTLADFYNLAVLITRQLVSATLFEANSRCRAMNAGRYMAKPKVKRRDVLAARRSLQWRKSVLDGKERVTMVSEEQGGWRLWQEYWRDLPRRQRLRVYDVNVRHDRIWSFAGWSKQKLGQLLSYEQVEKELGLDCDDDRFAVSDYNAYATAEHIYGQRNSKLAENSTSEADLNMGYESDPQSDVSSSISTSNTFLIEHKAQDGHTRNQSLESRVNPTIDSTENSTSQHSADEGAHSESKSGEDDDQEALAKESIFNAIDQYSSHYEEQRLWSIMDIEAPRSYAQDMLPLPPPQGLPVGSLAGRSQNDYELDEDWRAWCSHMAEWERYQAVINII